MVIAAAMPASLWQDHQVVEVLRAIVDRRMGLCAYVTAATAWLRVHPRLAALFIDAVSLDQYVASAPHDKSFFVSA